MLVQMVVTVNVKCSIDFNSFSGVCAIATQLFSSVSTHS